MKLRAKPGFSVHSLTNNKTVTMYQLETQRFILSTCYGSPCRFSGCGIDSGNRPGNVKGNVSDLWCQYPIVSNTVFRHDRLVAQSLFSSFLPGM